MQVWLGHCPEKPSITAWHTRLLMTWAQPYLCSFTQHHPLVFILCLSLDCTTSTFYMCIHAFVGAPSLPQWSCLLLCWLTSMYPFKTYLVHDFNLSSISKQSTSDFNVSSTEVFILLFCFVKIWTLIVETVVRPKRPVNICNTVVLYPPYLKLSQERPTRRLKHIYSLWISTPIQRTFSLV